MARRRWNSSTSSLPDIVLLDVRMPGIDGLEVARQLATLPEPPAVIFTTAFDEYALQAFDSRGHGLSTEADPRREAASAALAKAGRLTRPQLQQVASAAREPAHRSHIGVRGRDGLKLIPVEEVLCFHADQKYTTVKHQKGEDLIEDSLKTLEEEFAANFVRIHRNALVNTSYLERIARDASGQHFVHLRGMPDRSKSAGAWPAISRTASGSSGRASAADRRARTRADVRRPALRAAPASARSLLPSSGIRVRDARAHATTGNRSASPAWLRTSTNWPGRSDRERST